MVRRLLHLKGRPSSKEVWNHGYRVGFEYANLDSVKIIWQKLGEEMRGNVSAKVFNFQGGKLMDSVQN